MLFGHLISERPNQKLEPGLVEGVQTLVRSWSPQVKSTLTPAPTNDASEQHD